MKTRIQLAVLTLVTLFVAGNLKAAELNSPVPVKDGGTLIHVKNGTNKAMTFNLYVETKTGTGKFDNQLKIEPGQTAVWKLSAGQKVATTQKAGQTYYRVGLVGVEGQQGKKHIWGLVGGNGMLGREKRTTDVSGDDVQSFLNIQVRPMGDL